MNEHMKKPYVKPQFSLKLPDGAQVEIEQTSEKRGEGSGNHLKQYRDYLMGEAEEKQED